ncbi:MULTISPECIES: hypothetical protein [unclassified Nocardia]|uniref:hypothetical protein n=1 Tax=unclassified Nocardia TaxID=2637762 RepID=UPI001CE4378C|nr:MULTISPECIES: hypothetical protein [unclassified Nocardia]
MFPLFSGGGLLFVIAVVFILFLVTGRSNRRREEAQAQQANEVIPGRPTRAPLHWLTSNEREALLHRRLRDAMAALRTVIPFDNGMGLNLRADLEQSALAVDDHIVALYGVAPALRGNLLMTALHAVQAIEAGVAQYSEAVTQGNVAQLDQVRKQLAMVAEIQRSFGPY